MATIKNQTNKEENKKFVFTSKNVEEITEQISDGIVIKRYMNPWFSNEVGVRRSGISFGITPEEFQEYLKCADSVHYFAEKYCKIKREDGTIGPIKLRDYQKDILDLYQNPRVILCASRQSGKCFSFTGKVLVENMGEISIGYLYYKLLANIRKLTFLEKIKLSLYKLL